MWTLWLVCLVSIPGALVLEHVSSLQVSDIGSIHVAALVTFLWVVLAWLWPVRSLRNQILGLTVGLAFSVNLLTVFVIDEDWAAASRGALATVVQAGVTLAFYRWRIGDDNLTPHRPSDIVDLLVSSIVGALVVIPLGPVPGVWVDSSTFDLLWWTALSTVYVFVGSACVMLLVQRRPRTEAIPTRVLDVYLQLVVTGVCLGLVFAYNDYPLTWIVMLPAIWAGLSLGPWTSAAYSLTGTLAVIIAQSIPVSHRVYGPADLPNFLLLESLMAAFVFVVLLLSLVRDQRAHLAGEVVRRRQEAIDQAGLLGTVFESINEALVLMDTAGAVQLHNAAAVQILGREKLTVEPARWLPRMTERASFTYSYNRDGSEDGLRILAVQLAPVQYAGSDSVVAIVRDVTTEQRRIEELASFAAVAAHDLKSPLAAVQGWIEVAEDALDGDPDLALEALQRGRHATDRMSREIEDWLTYNVAREGVVQPEAIALQPCLDAIVAGYPGVDFVVRTPDTVMVDPTLLRHLLTNLIGNAVKYTVPGERPAITVRSFSGGDRGWVRLYVVDAGIGIPEGEEATIFEPFRRASSVIGNYEGSGLGLALCKRIVRRHGGLITAARNEGPGTTITVTLPRG
ncbi:MAG: sensor histidine kinase [Marmoricola sp.]|jgi:signal transduction histidine kinase|nr:sensor histidine kinase [Marmoricola sp.]